MSQPARSLSVAVDQAASLATGPQSRYLIFKPCHHLQCRRRFSSRLKQLSGQAIGALAFAFQICFVIGGRYFEPRDFGLQRLNLCC